MKTLYKISPETRAKVKAMFPGPETDKMLALGDRYADHVWDPHNEEWVPPSELIGSRQDRRRRERAR